MDVRVNCSRRCAAGSLVVFCVKFASGLKRDLEEETSRGHVLVVGVRAHPI